MADLREECTEKNTEKSRAQSFGYFLNSIVLFAFTPVMKDIGEELSFLYCTYVFEE